MRELREKMDNDKNHIYTYSKDYLGLTIDPKTLEEEKRKEDSLMKSKNISAQKFSSLIIKTKE